jgi:curved DNA-binding protein CbpA
MNIESLYQILNVSKSASDEEISAAYKKLALKFHPDKNPHRPEWANDAMTRLNLAYAAVMSHRFSEDTAAGTAQKPEYPSEKKYTKEHVTPKPQKHVTDPEIVTKQFIHVRESAKDALYRYFQYNLQRLPIREKIANRAIFNKITFSLRQSYHAIRQMKETTDDPELLEHFEVFNAMIFDFYRASECLNIIDSYNSQYDVEAYRVYRNGDEQLDAAQKEIFYDRHNRGYLKKQEAYSAIIQAGKLFQANLKVFPDSSWAVETRIKLEYTDSLRRYIELFFSDYQRPF